MAAVRERRDAVGIGADPIALQREAAVGAVDRDAVAGVARDEIVRDAVGAAPELRDATGVGDGRRARGVRPDAVALDDEVVAALRDDDAVARVAGDDVAVALVRAADRDALDVRAEHDAAAVRESVGAVRRGADEVAGDRRSVGASCEQDAVAVAGDHVARTARRPADPGVGASHDDPDAVRRRLRAGRVGADQIPFDDGAGAALDRDARAVEAVQDQPTDRHAARGDDEGVRGRPDLAAAELHAPGRLRRAVDEDRLADGRQRVRDDDRNPGSGDREHDGIRTGVDIGVQVEERAPERAGSVGVRVRDREHGPACRGRRREDREGDGQQGGPVHGREQCRRPRLQRTSADAMGNEARSYPFDPRGVTTRDRSVGRPARPSRRRSGARAGAPAGPGRRPREAASCRGRAG